MSREEKHTTDGWGRYNPTYSSQIFPDFAGRIHHMREASRSKSASKHPQLEKSLSASKLIREPVHHGDGAVPDSKLYKPAAGQFERKSSQKRMHNTISLTATVAKPDVVNPKPAGISYLEEGKIINSALVDHVDKLIKPDKPCRPISARDTTYHQMIIRSDVEDFKLPEKKPEGPAKVVAPPEDYRPQALKKHPYEVLSRSMC